MILSVILLLFSLLLEMVLPNIFKELILFTLIGSIIIIAKFDIKEKYKYVLASIFGLLYDFIFLATYIYSLVFFNLIVSILLKRIKDINNIFVLTLYYYICFIAYSFFLCLINISHNINYIYLIKTIIISWLFNTIYFLALYVVLLLYKKCNKRFVKSY